MRIEVNHGEGGYSLVIAGRHVAGPISANKILAVWDVDKADMIKLIDVLIKLTDYKRPRKNSRSKLS